MLDSIEKPKGALDLWLEADEERAADFWELIRKGQARRPKFGIEKCLEAWNSRVDESDRCPVKAEVVRKRLVVL